MPDRRRGSWGSPLAVAALSAACATNPVTGQRELTLMSEAQEIAMGRESDAQVKAEMGVYDDQALQQYVSRVGLQLAKLSERPNLPWQFTVVDQPAINAFALPGGFIYITRGILPFLDNEAELAGVLGHEIGHVTARHSVQQYTRSVGGAIALGGLGVFVPAARPFGQLSEQALSLLFLKYGRDDELQADGLGARYEAMGGWDPEGVPGMLSTLGRLDEAAGDRKGVPNWLSTHPEPLQRVAQIQPEVQKLKSGRSNFITDHNALLQRVDGVIFGDNPSGEVFYFSADKLPTGGQDAIRRILFNDKGEAKTLLQLIKEKNTAQGKPVATRADLRFGEGPNGQIFILNKRDNTIRRIVP